ncbi:MAG: NAD(P)H-quinone oxidoreductase [Rhodothermales bacterium]
MQAVCVINPGRQSLLEIQSVEKPAPGSGELLVKVHATALNRADLMQRNGVYPPPPGASDILGLEMAGTVEGWGASCDGWRQGDRVFGLLPGGGYAQYVVIPQALAMHMPDTMSFEDAAAVPEVFLTAFQALCWLGELASHENVLIHAGGSGVGTAGIQIAKQLGATVFVTASAGKHETCLELGADVAIDYKKEAFDEVIFKHTDGKGAHVVVDFIGAPYFEQNIAALGLDGRLVLLAMMGGSKVESVNLMQLFRKRIHLKASTLRSRSLAYKTSLTRDFQLKFGEAIEKGSLKPVVDSVFDWREAETAHARMHANQNTGKIVLRIS